MPLTPEERHERAVRSGKASQDSTILAARIVANWPELTIEQKTVIRTLLRPVINRNPSRATPARGDAA